MTPQINTAYNFEYFLKYLTHTPKNLVIEFKLLVEIEDAVEAVCSKLELWLTRVPSAGFNLLLTGLQTPVALLDILHAVQEVTRQAASAALEQNRLTVDRQRLCVGSQ